MSLFSRTKKPIATLLILVMLVSLVAGIGVIWNPSSTTEVSAATPYINASTGVISVPSATGTLGSDTNPFVILEIVPSEDMAQFGYLVEGQEPVDVSTVVLGKTLDDGSRIPASDTAYTELNMFLTEDFQSPSVIFSDQDVEDSELTWIPTGNTRTRYGYYEKVDNEYKEAHSDETYYKLETSYTQRMVTKDEIVDPAQKDKAVYNFVKVTEANKGIIDAYESDEGVAAIRSLAAFDDHYYESADVPGTGFFSKTADEYSYVMEGGEYSLNYKYVGDNKGSFQYYNNEPVYGVPYSTITDDTYEHHILWISGDPSSLETEGSGAASKLVFKYYGNQQALAEGLVTYSVKSVSSSNIQYKSLLILKDFNKYYIRKTDSSTHKDIYEYNPSSRNTKYFVAFQPDINGDYVIDKSNSSINTSVDIADLNLRYYQTDLYQRFVFLGKNKGAFERLSEEDEANNRFQKLGLINGNMVGEYVKSPAVPVSGPGVEEGYVYTANEEPPKYLTNGRTKSLVKIYNRDYNKYVFTNVAADASVPGLYAAEYTCSYSMTKVTNIDEGNYIWHGYNYGEENVLSTENSLYISDTHSINLQDKITYGSKLNVVVEPDIVYGSNTDFVSFGYDVVKSNDIFKKYSLGLTYKNNNVFQAEDTTAYQFVGWFYEPECVNPLDPSREITADTTIYACWKTFYASEKETSNYYNIHFEGNKPATVGNSAEVSGLPSDVDYVYAGNRIVMPNAIPTLEGYRFKGWYLSKIDAWDSNDNVFDFSRPITDGMAVNKVITLYAGWTPLSTTQYTIVFDKNLPAGAAIDTYATDMPGTIVDSAERSGYFEHGFVLNKADHKFISAKPGKKPSIPGYQFEGWYWEPQCLNRFEFDEKIPQNVIDTCAESGNYTITLYAKWITNAAATSKSYTVTFDCNEPANAVFHANLPEFTDAGGNPLTHVEVRTRFGESLNSHQSELPTYAHLAGNITEKLRTYQVKVISITPDDLRIEANLDLINRANLIVINQTCNDTIKSYWRDANYRNKQLFPVMDAGFRYPGKSYGKYHFTTSTDKVTFVDNDLSWPAAFRIYEKVAGVNGMSACPVIFDYSIYDSITYADSEGHVSSCTRTDSEGRTVYDNNTYKLYLMTQQMNPVTLYNAYVKDDAAVEQRFTRTGTITSAGIAAGMDKPWNVFSLVPSDVLTSEEWAYNAEDALGNIGISLSISHQRSAINNRVFIYNNPVANIVETIANATAPSNLEVHGQTEMNAFMHVAETSAEIGTTDSDGKYISYQAGKDASWSAQQFYRTGQVVYYLLKNAALYDNNSASSIRILEIEPSTHFRDDKYWFWYISRYIPNFTGTPTVRQMCTTELVGYTGDLNSEFDIIYVGIDDKELPSEFMPSGGSQTVTSFANVPKNADGNYPNEVSKASMSSYCNINTAVQEIPIAQVLSKPFYKLETVEGWEYAYSTNPTAMYNNGYYGIDEIVNPIKGKKGVATLNAAALSVYMDELGLYIDRDDSMYPSTHNMYQWYTLTSYTRKLLGITIYDYKENASGLDGTVARLVTKSKNGSVFLRDKNYNHYKNIEIKSSKLGNNIVSQWVNNGSSDFTAFLGNVKTADFGRGWTEVTDAIDFALTLLTDNNNDGLLWYSGDFALVNIYRRESTEERWVYHDGDTKVYAGDKIILLESGSYNTARYAYSSTGALESNAPKALLGTFGPEDDIDVYLYSGNDITSENYKALKEFSNAGYPVILDGDILKNGAVNEQIVGKSSNMYRFLTLAIANNAFVDSDRNRDADFIRSLGHKTFRLEKNGEVCSPEYNNGTYMDSDVFKLGFSINSMDSAKYSASLYFDINGDGIFDAVGEKIDSLEVSYIERGTLIERSGADENKLNGNTRYIIRRNIADYVGVIPWRLVVAELDDFGHETTIRDTLEGMCAYKPADSEKQIVNILQLVPDYEDNGTVYFPTKPEIELAKSKHGRGANYIASLNAVSDADVIESYFDGCLHPYDNDEFYNALGSGQYVNDGGVKRLRIDTSQDDAMNSAISGALSDMNAAKARYDSTVAEYNAASLVLSQLRRVEADYALEYYKTMVASKKAAIKAKWDEAKNQVAVQQTRVDAKQGEVDAALAAYEEKQAAYKEKIALKDSRLRVNNLIRSAGWFYYYTSVLDEYDVRFYRVSVSDLRTLSALPSNQRLVGGKDTPADSSDDLIFADADMLIVGCAEYFTDISDPASSAMIKSFMDSGKSILFTYNTISYLNKPTYKDEMNRTVTSWGYNNTLNFRSILGMDRYQICSTEGKKQALKTLTEALAAQGKGFDLPYMPTDARSFENCYARNYKGRATDIRYLTQGFTNATIADELTVSSSDILVKNAVKTNEGQIVSYPYAIPDNLTIAQTHSAYYQLNLESPNMKVWYTLSDDSGKYYKGKDVRNNYYLYSYGNVMYSGMGNSSALTIDEIKLFINTMIASYSSSARSTVPEILNSDRSSADTMTDYLYIDYDATIDTTNADSRPFGDEIIRYSESGSVIPSDDTTTEVKYYAKRVRFDLQNYSMVSSKELTVFLYPYRKDGKVDYDHQMKLPIYNMSDGSEVESRRIGTDSDPEAGLRLTVDEVEATYYVGAKGEPLVEYYVDVPISDWYYENLPLTLQTNKSDSYDSGKLTYSDSASETYLNDHFALDSENNRFEIALQVVMRYGRTREMYDFNVPLVGQKKLVILRRGMFELD